MKRVTAATTNGACQRGIMAFGTRTILCAETGQNKKADQGGSISLQYFSIKKWAL